MADETGGAHDHDDEQELGAVTFVGFLVSLAHTAAVHFGDVPDPVTGQTFAANLPAAQQIIEILSILEEKTRGNLSVEERQFFEQLLYELRMRYVEISKSAGPDQDAPRIILP